MHINLQFLFVKTDHEVFGEVDKAVGKLTGCLTWCIYSRSQEAKLVCSQPSILGLGIHPACASAASTTTTSDRREGFWIV